MTVIADHDRQGALKPGFDINDNGVADGLEVTGGTQWRRYTAFFVAGAGDTRIVFADKGTNNTLGTFLDDVRLVAQHVDIALDGLPETYDTTPGAIVWRNNDFSRRIAAEIQPEPNLTLYVPDYRDTATIDPNYQTEFTPGSATIAPGMEEAFEFQFDFDDDDIELWTRAAWTGFEKQAEEGWYKIRPNGGGDSHHG
jgi:hypothetical protein